MQKIRDLPRSLRPREKLITYGKESLTNSELLSIIFGVGTKNQDVGELAEKVFPSYSPLMHGIHLPANELASQLHIPLSHACKICAMFELGKRYYKQKEEGYIFSGDDVFNRLKYMYKYKKEHLIGIYLNSRNKIIHEEIISIGTVDASLISPKEVFEPAILYHAVSLILCHNHPSGESDPSKEDIVTTREIALACRIMHIRFLDHIIIGKKTFSSLKNEISFPS